MILAFVARKKAKEKINSDCEKELKKIENAILKSIDKGEFSTTIDGKISKEAEKILKSNGYLVTYGGRYNEIDTSIHW